MHGEHQRTTNRKRAWKEHRGVMQQMSLKLCIVNFHYNSSTSIKKYIGPRRCNIFRAASRAPSINPVGGKAILFTCNTGIVVASALLYTPWPCGSADPQVRPNHPKPLISNVYEADHVPQGHPFLWARWLWPSVTAAVETQAMFWPRVSTVGPWPQFAIGTRVARDMPLQVVFAMHGIPWADMNLI